MAEFAPVNSAANSCSPFTNTRSEPRPLSGDRFRIPPRSTPRDERLTPGRVTVQGPKGFQPWSHTGSNRVRHPEARKVAKNHFGVGDES
jgi:hypothetical protein